jgi:hypothetical protein
MSPEKEKKLKDKFPKIFEENFYFECGDGWFNIIWHLANAMQRYIESKSHQLMDDAESPQVIASQVKEKFGTLRFYVFGGDEVTIGMIDLAESLSKSTCEDCGNVGSLYKDGWMRTLCNSCESVRLQSRLKDNGSTS